VWTGIKRTFGPIVYHPLMFLTLIPAALNDILDYTGVGAVPIAGDILDLIVSSLYLVELHFFEFIVSLAELIPAVDFLPVHTVAATIVYMKLVLKDLLKRRY
ncbi:MAG: hypothetical protein ABEK01_04515, partial [Candidatus Nanohaloarchaea archaeon]